MTRKLCFGLDHVRSIVRARTQPGTVNDEVRRSARAVLTEVSNETRRVLPHDHPWRSTDGMFSYASFLSTAVPEREEAASLHDHVMSTVDKGRTDAEQIALDLLKRSGAGAYVYRIAEEHLLRVFEDGKNPDHILQSLRERWMPIAHDLHHAFIADSAFGIGVESAIEAVDALLSDELSMQLPRSLHVQFIQEDIQSRARIFAVSYGRKVQALNVHVDVEAMANAAHWQRIISDISSCEAALDAVWLRVFHASLRPNQVHSDDPLLRRLATDVRELLSYDVQALQPLVDPAPERHMAAALHIEAIAGVESWVVSSATMPPTQGKYANFSN